MWVTGRSCIYRSTVYLKIMNLMSETNEMARARWPSTEHELPHWCVAYTSANHEKRVSEQFLQRGIEHFLPQYESVRRWKDRRMTLHLPLFPGYVFVRFALCERLRVLQVPGVARLIGFNGRPAILPDKEIESLKISAAAQLRAEPHPYLTIGRRVRIKRGALQGVVGILVRKKNALRLVLSIDLIMRSASVEVEAGDVECMN
jgi:transcription antitermination factor NusG